MSVIEALILGVVQGITEFLPVSSSGHLVLLQKVFGISEPALLFDTLVHVGTLGAVFIVLRRDIWDILRRPVQALTGYLILATLPAVAAALLFRDLIERAFSSGLFLGGAFLITALFLAGAEFLSRRPGKPGGLPGKIDGSGLESRGPEEMTWLDALVIGVLQAAAIIPGISRSGSTLTGALSRRLDRDFAARFSFLLSIPAILGALALQLKDLAGTGFEAAAEAGTGGGGIGPAPLLAGTLAAAVVGFFSIRFMLRIVREKSLLGFALYVGLLGIVVLADQHILHFIFQG
jgi:undecaprenyl-diphosphatase